MPATGAFARALRHVERLVADGGDARGLRADILAAIRPVVGFDAYAWLLTDPQTCVGASPLADVPCLPELPRLVRLKYLTAVNRWTGIGRPPVARLRAATSDQPQRSLLWREMLRDLDVGDVASTVQRDRFGCWGFLDLWRTGPEARFGADEAAFLAEVADASAGGLRRAVADVLVGPPVPTTQSGPAVLLLTPQLQVQGQTPPTGDYLRSLLQTEPDVDPVPAVAYNVGAQLLAREAGVDDHPAWARVQPVDDQLMTVRADRLVGPDDGSGSPAGDIPTSDIAVSIEPASAHERTDLFVRAFGLTAREADLVTALAGGGDTRELARTLSVSEHTVQDHLKSVFGKTSARSRGQLLAWVRGS